MPKNKNKTQEIKAWARVTNRGAIEKEAIGQLEVYDKRKNAVCGSKVVPVKITIL